MGSYQMAYNKSFLEKKYACDVIIDINANTCQLLSKRKQQRYFDLIIGDINAVYSKSV